MKGKKRHTIKRMKEYRRELRNNMTPAEAFLWKQLKSRQLENRRFTRQHSIGHYIVDFYCASEKLVVELDGEVHASHEAIEYDEKRTRYLENLGYTVLRFENKMVFDFFPSVRADIISHFKN